MTRNRSLKTALIAIGFLAVPVIGIATIPELDYSSLHTENPQSDSSRTEGDSNPQPVATVTRYAEAPTPTNSPSTGTCRISLVVGPSPAVPAPTSSATPYAPVYGLAHTHSVHVKIPCPKDTVTETPTSTK